MQKIKDKLIIHYSNISTPFLNIYCYHDNILVSTSMIELEDYLFDEDKIINLDKLAETIKTTVDICDFDLVLSLKETIKNTISLPKMNKYKREYIKKNELKNRFNNYNNDYITFEYENEYNLGYIYYTYFVPKTIIDSFKGIAKILNVRFNKVSLFGDFLYNNINYSDNYFVIYKENNIITLLNVINNKVNTIYEIPYTTPNEIVKTISLVLSKHEFELEKSPLLNYVSNAHIDLISIGLDLAIELKQAGLQPVSCEIDFSQYKFKGKLA